MGRTLPSRTILWCLFAALVLGGFLLLGYGLWKEREEKIGQAQELTRNGALFLEDHTVRVLESTDALVRRTVSIMETTDPREWHLNTDLWSRLKGLSEALPEIGFLWVVDRSGQVALTTSRVPAPPLDVGDRAYVQAHYRDGKEFFLGPVIQGRVSDVWFFTVSRPIRNSLGEISGIVVAAIDVQNFLDLQRFYALGSESAFLVVTDDGSVLLRQPHESQYRNQRVDISITEATPQQGTAEAVSPFDGKLRILSWRRIPTFGLFVAVSVAKEVVLQPWRQNLWRVLPTSLLVAVLLVVASLAAWHSGRREQRMLEALQQSKDDLEHKVAARTRALSHALTRAEEATRRAEAATVMKSRFIAGASHDLRQPMQALRLFLDVLDHYLKDDTCRGVLRRATEAMGATEQLLAALLDISRLEAGTITPNIAAADVGRLLDGLARECPPQAERKGLTFRYRRPGGELSVLTDSVLLQRMLRNLLVNAVRYTSTGGVLLSCRRRGDRLRIEVWDTGKGIPADKLDRIFEEYYQLDEHGDRVQGLGLGLSIVHRTAELLGHPLTVRSRVGRGSLFAVTVPLMPAPVPSLPCAAEAVSA